MRPGSTLLQVPPGRASAELASFSHADDFEEVGFDRPDPKFRLFFGRPNPNDSSRFEISFESDGGPGTIEGRLKDDDSIGWNVLSGPLTQR